MNAFVSSQYVAQSFIGVLNDGQPSTIAKCVQFEIQCFFCAYPNSIETIVSINANAHDLSLHLIDWVTDNLGARRCILFTELKLL